MSTRRSLSALLFLIVASLFVGCAGPQRPDGGRGRLPVGSKLPNLAFRDEQGTPTKLGKRERKWQIIYFYPKDGTPGCTKEACAFRDNWKKLQRAEIDVLGVSDDSRESHLEFVKEHKLPFHLVADTDQRFQKAFGVGSTVGFLHRVSFLINPSNKVAKVYPDVDPGVHASEIIADVKAAEKGR